MSKIKRLYQLFTKRKGLLQLFNSYEYGYLYETGWSQSAMEYIPIDKNGDPLPWISIPAIEILKEKSLEDLFIFEYGSGNSTIWFSKRVKKIVSIEHDDEWYDYQMKQKSLDNTTILFKKMVYGGEYSKEIKKYNEIDIALIDGRDRVSCAINAITQLSKKGIIILDDAQRKNYEKARQYLLNIGFRELKLVGMNVGRPMKKTTSFFYRDGNCLGI
jgi:precorrin-6B methylase 2